MHTQPDWAQYIAQMEQILALELDDARRAELLTQFNRIAALALLINLLCFAQHALAGHLRPGVDCRVMLFDGL